MIINELKQFVPHDFKVYIAGPISGIAEGNRPAFMNAETKLHAMESFHTIFNPMTKIQHNQDPEYLEQFSSSDLYRFYLGFELPWIMAEATHIYMLNGWENSTGAKIEHALAVACDCKVMYEDSDV